MVEQMFTLATAWKSKYKSAKLLKRHIILLLVLLEYYPFSNTTIYVMHVELGHFQNVIVQRNNFCPLLLSSSKQFSSASKPGVRDFFHINKRPFSSSLS